MKKRNTGKKCRVHAPHPPVSGRLAGKETRRAALSDAFSGKRKHRAALTDAFAGKEKRRAALTAAFAPPPPLEADAFLRTLPRPKTGHFAFLLLQAGYIRKWIWAASAALFLAALYLACLLPADDVWLLSALLPFLALTAVAESARSGVYEMEELEMASRFSLKNIVLARMELLGLFHGIAFLILIPLAARGVPEAALPAEALLQSAACLLIPYLSACAFGLWITRKLRGKEGLYACLGESVLTAAAPFSWHTSPVSPAYCGGTGPLLFLLTGLTALTVLEYRKNLKETEELTWNLS